MATFEELRTYVDVIIQDESLSQLAGAYLNQGVLEIAGGMQSTLGSWITPPLPELFTIGTVTTDSVDAAYTTYAEIKNLISVGDTIGFTFNDVAISVTFTGDYSQVQADINTELVSNAFTSGDIVVSWNSNDLVLTCANDPSSDTLVGDDYTDIDTSDTVTPIDTALVTAYPYVSMPSNFHRNLQFVANSNGVEVDIANSFISFSETYPLLNQSGTITEIVEQGGLFYYQGIPTSAENITLHYYRKPVEMDAIDDEPDGIPSHLQRDLLVNYTAWKIFELIEDGLEGPGPNTQRYKELFLIALRTLELTIPYDIRGINLMKDNA